MKIYICLENIRSLYNVGAILRTCSFFGVREVIMLGYSGKYTTPGGKSFLNPKLNKVSLGSENDVNITFLNKTSDLFEFANKNKLKVISLEQGKDSIDISQWSPEIDAIIVLGNEVDGVSSEILNKSYQKLEIQKTGIHNSLNVSTACGILLYRISLCR